MDSNSKRNRIIGCQEMPKFKARSTPGNNITPRIRIVHIIPPKIIITDAANFRALVHKLTGKHSARSSRPSKKKSMQKKLRPLVSPEKSESSGLKENYMAEAEFQCDHLCSKRSVQPNLVSFEDQHVASYAEAKSECIEELSLNSCANFSCRFGVDGDLDMFATIMYSDSMQSGFSTIGDLTSPNQIDSHSSIFRQSEIDLYQHYPSTSSSFMNL